MVISDEQTTPPAAAPLPVLVVEDEAPLRTLIARTLGFAGFSVVSAATAAEARTLAAEVRPAVVVLDVMLPDGSGFDLAQSMRAAQPGIGVLVLTARDGLEDRLNGFAFGADDYLTKPFSVAELVARLTALHRRVTTGGIAEPGPPAAPDRTLTVGEVTLDEGTYRVTRAGEPVELSPTEFKLLRYLMRNHGVVVSKEQIIGQVWRYDFVGDVGVVEKAVSQLRRKLGGAPDSYIRTVRGFGYTVR